MFVLIIGGSGSGKSEYAEQRLLEADGGHKIYLATMQPFGQEGAERIARHRKLRAGKGFATVECADHIETLSLAENTDVLLEDLSNLLSNEMFSPAGRGMDCLDVIKHGLQALIHQTKNLVIVTNQVDSDGCDWDGEMAAFVRLLGELNRFLASLADEVIEVVAGIPLTIKIDEKEVRT
ncbi:MAG: bifunctional adenosylcobinamide kinase/adenosylcobinamide-phosphate guanylyltransferase [Lachnospiraceae bacterium]|nr:bifunctional adenosylcobinamide kinase/adenosylcobinamide-phosphate guanylyltransferase [Lachnospiraceae bacterium]